MLPLSCREVVWYFCQDMWQIHQVLPYFLHQLGQIIQNISVLIKINGVFLLLLQALLKTLNFLSSIMINFDSVKNVMQLVNQPISLQNGARDPPAAELYTEILLGGEGWEWHQGGRGQGTVDVPHPPQNTPLSCNQHSPTARVWPGQGETRDRSSFGTRGRKGFT